MVGAPKKLLSVFMSFVLAFTLVPLPAYAESAAGGDAQATPTGGDAQALVAGTSADLGAGIVSGEGDGQDAGMTTQAEGETEFDKVGESFSLEDDYFTYYFHILSIDSTDASNRTAELYMMGLKYNYDENDSSKWTAAVRDVPNGSLDWAIPGTVKSVKTGLEYTVAKVSLTTSLHSYSGNYLSSDTNDQACPLQYMKSITIPSTVEEICAFGASQNPYYMQSAQRILWSYLQKIEFKTGSKVTELPEDFACFFYNLSEVTLPAGLEKIGANAFSHCNSLQSVSIPNSVKEIGNAAFYGASLTSLTLPESLVTIGNSAFSWDSSDWRTDDSTTIPAPPYTNLVIPDKVETIGEYAFAVPGESRIGTGFDAWSGSREGLYYISNFTSITLGKSVKTIGKGAFACSSISSIELPASLEYIGEDAFIGSALERVTFASDASSQLKTLGGFAYCIFLEDIDIPNSVTTIDDMAFFECTRVESAFIPASVTNIGNMAFAYSGLKSLTIAGGSNELAIEGGAFVGCPQLTGATITLPRRVSQLGHGVFKDIPNATYYVYNDKLELYDAQNPSARSNMGIKVPIQYVPSDAEDKWGARQFEGETDTAWVYLPIPWQPDQNVNDYDTSDSDNWVPKVDVRSSVVYYPETLDTLGYEGSFSFYTYVKDAKERRASYEAGETKKVKFNSPRFVSFDAGTDIAEEEVVDVRGGNGLIEVKTSGAKGTDARVCVFDTAGDLVASGQAVSGYAAIEGIVDGTYTVVAFANNARFTTIGSEADLAAMGVDQDHYAKAANVIVTNGSADVVELAVPALAASTLTGVVGNSSVNIGATEVMMGTEAYAVVSFTLKDSYSADKVTVKVPAGLDVTSVYSKSQDYLTAKKATFNSSSRTLTVNIGDGKTLGTDKVHRLWVGLKPAVPGYYSVNASVTANGITSPVGSASFNSYAVSLEVPTDPVEDAKDSVVPVTVHAAPGSYVTVTMGNKEYRVGPTNKSGTATTEEIKLWDAIRDEDQPSGVATIASEFTVRATLEVGGVTYADMATVGVKRTDVTDVQVWSFSFKHADSTYSIIEQGRRVALRPYYTYVANGKAKNEFWTFTASFKSNKALTDTATVQVQMLDGSSRFATMKLVNQEHYTGPVDALGSTGGYWLATYSTTVRIEQGGDHVFPSNLVPCGFDVVYGLSEEGEPLTQVDTEMIKWGARWGSVPDLTKDVYKAESVREVFPGMSDSDVSALAANADTSIAMFQNFAGYVGSFGSGADALDYYAAAVWNEANNDPDFKKTIEDAAPDGTKIPTSSNPDSPTDTEWAKGTEVVKEILVGNDNNGGIFGRADVIAGVFYDKGTDANGKARDRNYYTGISKKPRESSGVEDFLGQFKPEGNAPTGWDQEGSGWDVFTDDGSGNSIYDELLASVGTPRTGDNPSSDLTPPNKFGVRVNNDDKGIPSSFEIVDSNGNHYEFNVPGFAQDITRGVCTVANANSDLYNTFTDFTNSKLGRQSSAAVAAALKALSEKGGSIAGTMATRATAAGKELSEDAKKAGQKWVESEMAGIAATKAAYDNLKAQLQSWRANELQKAIDDAEAELANIKKQVEHALQALCKTYLEGLEKTYGTWLPMLRKKAGTLCADYGLDALWTTVCTTVGNNLDESDSVNAKTVRGVRSLWKYTFGGVQASLEKQAKKNENTIRNLIQQLLNLCNPQKNATYQKKPILDPSGIVYAAVESNTISGVEAIVYEVSGSSSVVWNAEEYDQVNPQTTGSDGSYGWNVPVGTWQVKFSKEGYEAAQTDALPVPPPQMDLTTPMFTTTAPQVVAVNASPTYVEVVFDQYMNTTKRGIVYVDDVDVSASAVWQDMVTGTARDVKDGEAASKGVAKVLRVPLSGKSLGTTAKVGVVGFVSYSGIAPNNGSIVEKSVTVQEQPTSIEFVSGVGEDSPLPVKVTDANTDENTKSKENSGSGTAVVLVKSGSEPLAGVTVMATLDNDVLAAVNSGTTFTGTTDANGQLSIPLTGKLPGLSVLTATAAGSLSTQGDVYTVFTDETQVARPTVKAGDTVIFGPGSASPLDVVVTAGTRLTFGCATEGATIYYTTNGDCPCDDTSQNRQVYTEPITVTQSIDTLRVRASRSDLTMSEDVTIHLTVVSGTADKSALAAAINKANASPYTDSAQTSQDGTDVYANAIWVTQAAKDALAAAKAQAAAVAADTTAAQELVDEATANLNAAMAGYVPKAGTKELSPVFIQVAKPVAQSFTYDGTPKVGVASGAGYTLIGTVQATDPGTYTATAKLSSGYAWADGSAGDAVLTWSIAEAKSEWKRLQGDFALDTMASIVREGWSGQAGSTVVLATFDGYWDALTAAGIAGMAGAPVLMTSGGSLSPQTAGLIAELRPATVVVCGGTAAVSQATADQAAAICGSRVERLSGQTATGTAVDLFEKAPALTGGSWSRTAFVCTNDGYWDALSAAPIAFAKNMPIFLTEGAGGISDETLSAMRGNVDRVYIVGGTAAVGDGVVARLQGAGIQVAGRLAGDTAIETSEAVAEYGLALGMTCAHMGVATNGGYWDALSGAALCGKRNSVLVLAGGADSHSVGGFVASHSATIAGAYVFGGPAAVDDAALAALQRATS